MCPRWPGGPRRRSVSLSVIAPRARGISAHAPRPRDARSVARPLCAKPHALARDDDDLDLELVNDDDDVHVDVDGRDGRARGRRARVDDDGATRAGDDGA